MRVLVEPMNSESERPRVEQEMRAADVGRCLDLFAELGITVWLDGGWGVDALLEEQTRQHGDLDIILEADAAEELRSAFLDRGSEDVATDDRRDWNYVMGNERGALIDFHVVNFAEDGRGIYGPLVNGEWYPASAFGGGGRVGSRSVRCLAAEYQMESHTGYDPDEDDIRDVRALHDRFGLPVPDEYSEVFKTRDD